MNSFILYFIHLALGKVVQLTKADTNVQIGPIRLSSAHVTYHLSMYASTLQHSERIVIGDVSITSLLISTHPSPQSSPTSAMASYTPGSIGEHRLESGHHLTYL